ncbi:MAG: glycosyltransferase [Pseudomonadota bacterium]
MGLPGVLAGLVPGEPRPETPTTSLYFASAMAPHLEDGAIRRVEPNVFLAQDKLIVMRHWSAATRRILAERPELTVIYFIDDDVWSLDGEQGLKAAYLGRLRRLAEAFDQQLRARTIAVVSPSPRILAHFPEHETHILAPALIHALAPLDHHDERQGPVRLVFCGTASHRSDLDRLSGILAELLSAHARLHLTTFLGRQVPRALKLSQCTHHEPQGWALYRSTLAAARFHIGLAPLAPTPFNLARSGTRLLDHAACGAAGLYSAVGPFEELIEDGANGRLVGSGPEAWKAAICALLEDRPLCRRLAAGGQASAAKLGAPGRVRRFWSALLGL